MQTLTEYLRQGGFSSGGPPVPGKMTEGGLAQLVGDRYSDALMRIAFREERSPQSEWFKVGEDWLKHNGGISSTAVSSAIENVVLSGFGKFGAMVKERVSQYGEDREFFLQNSLPLRHRLWYREYLWLEDKSESAREEPAGADCCAAVFLDLQKIGDGSLMLEYGCTYVGCLGQDWVPIGVILAGGLGFSRHAPLWVLEQTEGEGLKFREPLPSERSFA